MTIAQPAMHCAPSRPTPWREAGMTDVLTRKQRRLNMSRIHGKVTKPQVLLRRALARARLPLPPSPPRSAGFS